MDEATAGNRQGADITDPAPGVVAGVLLLTVLGGYSRIGARTNGGWFALIVLLACLPFGGLLLTLGVAKWFRNRRPVGPR